MSVDDLPADDLASARQAVDDAAEALIVATRKRVPGRELAEARQKLKTAEARLERARQALTRRVHLSGPEPSPQAKREP